MTIHRAKKWITTPSSDEASLQPSVQALPEPHLGVGHLVTMHRAKKKIGPQPLQATRPRFDPLFKPSRPAGTIRLGNPNRPQPQFFRHRGRPSAAGLLLGRFWESPKTLQKISPRACLRNGHRGGKKKLDHSPFKRQTSLQPSAQAPPRSTRPAGTTAGQSQPATNPFFSPPGSDFRMTIL